MQGNYLMHEGRSKRDGAVIGSGRYPLGSGEEPYQSDRDGGFNVYVRNLKAAGMTEPQIAKLNHMSSTELRAKVSIAKNEQLAMDRATAIRLREHGYGPTEIGRKMGGISESTVRGYLKGYEEAKEGSLNYVADTLKQNIDKDGRYIDIGPGSELYFAGVSKTKLQTAAAMLKEQGYERIVIQADQMGLNKNQKTYITVLAPPGTQYRDVVNNMSNIKTIDDRFVDNAKTTTAEGKEKIHYPDAISADRIMIRYAEEGGLQKDGVIELRKGVKDLDLGADHYAQVRINVDNTHYLKGMAMYAAEDMPKGVDVIFNTNKKAGTPAMSSDPDAKQVFKPMKDPNDPINPFGSTIRSQHGALNICKEEGKWDDQRDRLASQFLSKQSPQLAKKQLDLSYAIMREQLDTIEAYTNPAVKKKLLQSFADSADAAAVELHAAALPRQSWKVILPLTDIASNEVYAPTYRQGEKVVLVRYPHGGIFEIPELKVNNNVPSGKKVLGNATDAIGISAKVAEQLSGADFDGDSVIVIPTRGIKIRTQSPIAELRDFDPKASYPHYEGMKRMTHSGTQREMGKISNLITDMTIQGADISEITRAVRHSMVVIDAEKHYLDYKTSEKDNRIKELKEKYQTGGASTLISRAKNEYDIQGVRTERKYAPDPITGEKTYKIKDEAYMKNGKEVHRITKSTRMAETKDAFTLSSGTQMENIYAEYANQCKAMANEARRVMVNTKGIIYDPAANKAYDKEVKELKAALTIAQKNAPRERIARAVANETFKAKLRDNPDKKQDKDWVKKAKTNALNQARDQVGAHKEKIDITPKQWEAIQAGAIHNTTLTSILNNAKEDQIKKYAAPKASIAMTSSQVNRMKAYAASGFTIADIADAMGVSTSTVSKYLK